MNLKPSTAAVWLQCPAAAGLIDRISRDKPAPSVQQRAGTERHAEVEQLLKGRENGPDNRP